MRLSSLGGSFEPHDIVGRWVHTKVPFYVQWEAASKCAKGPELARKFNYGPELAWVCNVTEDPARPDQGMDGNWTVTCYFPTAIGKGAIGSQTANNLDALVTIYNGK